jgi:hypothetical protein
MLAMQFFLLVVLAWRVLVPADEPLAGAQAGGDRETEQKENREERWSDAESQSQKIEAQLQVLDRVVEQLGAGTPDGLVQLLEEQQRENQILKDDARVYRALEARVRDENRTLARELEAAVADRDRLAEDIEDLEDELGDQRQLAKQYDREIAALNRKLESGEEGDDDASLAATFGQLRFWIWAGCGAIVGALVVVGIQVFYPGSREEWELDEQQAGGERETEMGEGDQAKNPPQQTNNDSEPNTPS